MNMTCQKREWEQKGKRSSIWYLV